jgi:hypothetical protein
MTARLLLAAAALALAGCGPAPTGSAASLSGGHVVYDAHPSGCHVRGTTPATVLPDPRCTPGAVDPKLTRAVICAPGWSTATVRPPSSETGKAKTMLMTAYGLTKPAAYELDHLIPLELGGSSAVTNLWPELGPAGNPKDGLENRMHKEVCAGTLALADAQRAIAANWTTAR